MIANPLPARQAASGRGARYAGGVAKDLHHYVTEFNEQRQAPAGKRAEGLAMIANPLPARQAASGRGARYAGGVAKDLHRYVTEFNEQRAGTPEGYRGADGLYGPWADGKRLTYRDLIG